MVDHEFIKRCLSPEFQEVVKKERKKKHYISNKWQRENPELHAECRKKYEKTEKGRLACKKRIALYHRRIRHLCMYLNEQEKEAIRLFYVNCPEGYQVDHIIPISKGGHHHISNLQYLTPYENCSKGAKTPEEMAYLARDYYEFDEEEKFCKYCDDKMITLSEFTMFCERCRKAFGIQLYGKTKDLN